MARIAAKEGEKPPRTDMLFAALSGDFLLIDVNGCGVYAAKLKDDLDPEMLVRLNIGRIADALPYRGIMLVATNRGLYLVPPPAGLPKNVPPGAGEEAGELPGLAPKRKGERTPMQLTREPVGRLQVCGDRLVLLSGQ